MLSIVSYFSPNSCSNFLLSQITVTPFHTTLSSLFLSDYFFPIWLKPRLLCLLYSCHSELSHLNFMTTNLKKTMNVSSSHSVFSYFIYSSINYLILSQIPKFSHQFPPYFHLMTLLFYFMENKFFKLTLPHLLTCQHLYSYTWLSSLVQKLNFLNPSK